MQGDENNFPVGLLKNCVIIYNIIYYILQVLDYLVFAFNSAPQETNSFGYVGTYSIGMHLSSSWVNPSANRDLSWCPYTL